MRVLVGACAVLSMAGCGGGAVAPLDAQGAPDAYVPEVDAATADAGSDAGHGGTCTVTESATEFGSLTAECLPRCTAATLAAYAACADSACSIAALRDDSMPPATYVISGQSYPLDCFTCYVHQYGHCAAVAGCAAEVWAVQTCDPSTDPGGCATQNDALTACIDAHSAAFRTCVQDPVMGIGPCFAR